MIFDNKRVLSIALATALLGGTVGAFVSRSYKSGGDTSAATTQTAPVAETGQRLSATTPTTGTDQVAQAEPDAYRDGFVDGVRTVLDGGKDQATRTIVERQAGASTRTVYRNTGGATSGRYANNQRVYYDYEQPRKRSFWQKHRDKLTVAAGAGGGALLGGLIGGKKGAAIGALAGGGGSALYTYKLRKRNRNY